MSKHLKFNPAQHIQIAADSVAQLRQQDVDRLFDTLEEWHHAELVRYLIQERPAFQQEIITVLYEMKSIALWDKSIPALLQITTPVIFTCEHCRNPITLHADPCDIVRSELLCQNCL